MDYSVRNNNDLRNWPSLSLNVSPSVPSLTKRILAVAGIALLAFGSLASAAPLQRRYDGGVNLIQPDFSSLAPLTPQFGPFYSQELSCYNQKQDLASQFSYLTDPFSDTCSSSMLNAGEYSLFANQEIPSQMQPYCQAVDGLTPLRDRSVLKFPENFSAFVFNEIGLVENGNKGCLLNEDPKQYYECQQTVDNLLRAVKNQGQEELFETQVLTENSYRSKGFIAGLPSKNGIKKVSFGMNPEVHTNYREAIKVLEDNFLADPCFFFKGPQEILTFIQDIHGVLLHNIPANEAEADYLIMPGVFRTKELMVFNHEGEQTLSAFVDRLKELGVTEAELKTFRRSYPKISDKGEISKILSKAELKVWKKLAYFAPTPSQIEDLMNDFVINFKKYAEQDLHPVALAAWVHCEIGRIHPFSDGNGRLARLLANAVLIRGGYEPVIFFDDEVYTKAVNEDEFVPGTFASYLAELIEEQADGPQFLVRA